MRLINDLNALKSRLSNENSDLSRQVEDLENQVRKTLLIIVLRKIRPQISSY